MQNKNTYLFLQGPNSQFFKKLGQGLKAMGHNVLRVNLNGGDLFFWSGEDYVNYTDTIANWQNFLVGLQTQHNFTDVLLFGDAREYHKIAIDIFSQNSAVKIHVFEEGYFRPFWITHEIGGVNKRSPLPRDRAFYDALEQKEPAPAQSIKPSFRFSIFWTFIYYILVASQIHIFKNYQQHRNTSPELDARYWLKRLFKYKAKQREALQIQKDILKSGRQYFLVPLQLWSDTQIRINSRFADIEEFIADVTKNFAENAPKNTVLVFKNHPQDNGIFNLKKITKNYSKKQNISERVFFVDGGHLPSMIKGSLGVVLINSTSGLQAIGHSAPTICLGESFYNIDGLTNQNKLEEFWHSRTQPDLNLYAKFRNYVMEKTQINGSFHSVDGIELLVKNTLKKIG